MTISRAGRGNSTEAAVSTQQANGQVPNTIMLLPAISFTLHAAQWMTHIRIRSLRPWTRSEIEIHTLPTRRSSDLSSRQYTASKWSSSQHNCVVTRHQLHVACG